jgi:ubiquinol-cytochrome c reductase cytochrome c subunit
MNILKKTAGLKSILTLAMAFGMLTVIAPAIAQSATNAEQVTRGESLFEKNGCYMCHGTVGQGGVGPAIAVDLVPYAALSIYVRNPTGDMPPFGEKVLSDADLKDIYAYLSALPAPKSPDSTPLLPKVTPMSSDSK